MTDTVRKRSLPKVRVGGAEAPAKLLKHVSASRSGAPKKLFKHVPKVRMGGSEAPAQLIKHLTPVSAK